MMNAESVTQNERSIVCDVAGFICDAEGRAVDMFMTNPAVQFPALLEKVNTGKQPATDEFKERINAYHP